MELFVQVGYDALDTGDGGITGETDPVRHREVAKKLEPAFSTRNLRRAKEAVIMQHIDLFVQRVAEHGQCEKGVDINRWNDWLGLDLAAALTYGADMGQMREMQDLPVLTAVLKCNFLILIDRITRKIPLLTPLKFLCIPPSTIFLIPKLLKIHSENVKHRIETHASAGADTTTHKDYLDQLLSTNSESLPYLPSPKQLLHRENISSQLLLATWQPLTTQFPSLILFLLSSKNHLDILTAEIRTTFQTYTSLTLETIAQLKYPSSCISESLRLIPETADGLPRISPGNTTPTPRTINGESIPPSTICQISYFAAQRSKDNFTNPPEFHPERWLQSTPSHPLYDPQYKDDNLKASKPFSQGPRGCPGAGIATGVISLFIARLLWRFDLEAVGGGGFT